MNDWTKIGAYTSRMDSAEIWQAAPEPKPQTHPFVVYWRIPPAKRPPPPSFWSTDTWL